MNIYASEKKDFIKYENVQQLFKELFNICKLFDAHSHFYYCYCHRNNGKCDLCKFSDFFYDTGRERYLLTYRNNEKKFLKIVDNYWFFVCKIKKSDHTALDFFNREYTRNFKDYRNGIDISMKLDEIIKSENELIELNGLKKYLDFFYK